MQMYPLAIAYANIRHRRYLPKAHHFKNTLTYLWFDPDQLERFVQNSHLWSKKNFALLSLNPDDFLTMASGSIRQKIALILQQEKQYNLLGTDHIRVLALPRCLGFRFNSVVFYYIYDATERLIFILSEITNNPWRERKVYVHDCQLNAKTYLPYTSHQFDFQKEFHVSPFMPMDLDYRWTFSNTDDQAVVHMQLFRQGILQFDATMNFKLTPITSASQQHRYAVCNVFEPFRMVFGIYLNAWRLWKKKIPFYRHPKKNKGN